MRLETPDQLKQRKCSKQKDTPPTSRRGSFEEQLDQHGWIVFTNKGYSMMPMLRENKDLMIIQKRSTNAEGKFLRCKKYDAVLYKRGDRYILHRILKVCSDGYIICGDHNWQREYDIKDKHILGILTAFVRNGVEIPVNHWKYRIYVHLWCDFFPIRAAILYSKHIAKQALKKILPNKMVQKLSKQHRFGENSLD